jgi:hypothetical protein
MKLFSARKGIKPLKNVIQINSMDTDLRNRLWNALISFYWNQYGEFRKGFYVSRSQKRYMQVLVNQLWHDYFKRQLDTLDDNWTEVYSELRSYFFGCAWNEVYDFIEFIANTYYDKASNQQFMDFCNQILEGEISAYRFVGGQITPMTSQEEIETIEDALINGSNLSSKHLKQALTHFVDREAPDYRNSIKESISAVEAICNQITAKPNSSLGDALNAIEKQGVLKLHPALKQAFSKFYGYASDGDGIRHALQEETNVSSEDAKFMLVSCSAFINYITIKASKAGIKL